MKHESWFNIRFCDLSAKSGVDLWTHQKDGQTDVEVEMVI